jgi:hypothetical protein
MRRLSLLGLTVLLVAAASAAQTPRHTDSELQIERRLLILDLTFFRELRQREEGARARLGEVLGRVDRALTGETLSVAALDRLGDDLSVARAAAHAAAERVDRQLDRIGDRLRRIAVLREPGGRANRDPVSGRWRVRVGPSDEGGGFELHLDGTVVSGSYRMDSGSQGSLRGTYTGGVLTLTRIDSRSGIDSEFLGTIDDFAGTITGLWQTRSLANNAPATGGWSAVRDPGGESPP